jgi:RND family efflux transporter MFP subunit
MKNSLTIIALVFLVACGGNEKSIEELIEAGDLEALKAKQSELTAEIKEDQAKITLLNEALQEKGETKKLPLVSVYKIESQEFKHFVELQGSVETDQNIVVYPEFSGTLLDFKVSMGDQVSKGQVIATIDDGGMNRQLSQMQEKAKLSKITYEKRKRLWDQKIGSEIDYLGSETQYLADQDAVKQMQAQVAKATVRAPFNGVIDETLADEGQLVSPGTTPLFRIVNLSNMFIKADVPEKYLASINKGKLVMVNVPVLDTVINTKIKKVSNYIDPANRTFRVEIDVPNKDGKIKPNLTAKLMINDYQNSSSVLIPQGVISEDSNGEQYVYRAEMKSGNTATATKVFIKTGLKQGDNIEVLSGLTAADAIIKDGARTVKDNQDVEIIK